MLLMLLALLLLLLLQRLGTTWASAMMGAQQPVTIEAREIGLRWVTTGTANMQNMTAH
jgi:hypothetical protein